MIILAHDGSLYGDWVARYALHFAAADSDRKLLLLHVSDDRVDQAVAENRFSHLAELCAEHQLHYHQEILPLSDSVHRTLRQATPHNPEALLLCGTRIKPRHNAFLRGSVAELLLRGHQCPVLAVRVVQPGLLGLPHTVLLPLDDSDGYGALLAPLVRRLAPQLQRLYFLRALPVNPLTHRHLSAARQDGLHHDGHRTLDRTAAELTALLGPSPFAIDRRVLLTTDPGHALLIEASRLKAQLLLVATSRRSLARRVLTAEPLEHILRDTPCDVAIYRSP